MTLPEADFGDLLLPQWMEDEAALHRVGFDLAVAWPGKLNEVGSPSHRIIVTRTGDGEARVTLGPASDVPNRDLVLDACGAQPSVRAYGGAVPVHGHHVSVVVPSTWFGAATVAHRHVIFLLDRSGSMGGAPLEQGSDPWCFAADGEQHVGLRSGLVISGPESRGRPINFFHFSLPKSPSRVA